MAKILSTIPIYTVSILALFAMSFIKSITSPSCPIIYRKIPAPATSITSGPKSDLVCFNKDI